MPRKTQKVEPMFLKARPPTKRERDLDNAESRGYSKGYSEATERLTAKLASTNVQLEVVKTAADIMRTNAQLASSVAQIIDNLGSIPR